MNGGRRAMKHAPPVERHCGMPVSGQIHLVSAFVAIAAGALVLGMRPKGGRWHRRLGWTYLTAMLVLNGTALSIYRLFGGFGPFHVFALISLVGIVLGATSARRARRHRLSGARDLRDRAIVFHYYWMTWSYVGLIAALASETITRHPAFHPLRAGGAAFGLAVAGATLLVVTVGAVVIRRKEPKFDGGRLGF
jgi:uncharacterized membrane protein